MTPPVDRRPAAWGRLVAGGLTMGAAAYLLASVGVYHERESGEPYLFLKHRPSPIFCFRSHVGESDRQLASLSPARREEEMRFREFVETRGGWERAVHLPASPCPPP